jgi:membrane protease YdiL (CAAX protease family)
VDSVFLSPSGRLRSGWRFLIAALLSFIALLLAESLAAAFYPNLGSQFELLSRTLALVLLLILYDILSRTLDGQRRPMCAMGLGLDRGVIWQILIGGALGAVMIIGAVAWIARHGEVTVNVHWDEHTLRPFFITLFTLMAAAMSEEVLFRGYPFQRLLEAGGAVVAIVVSAAFFAVVHWANPHAGWTGILNTALVGVLLAIAYLRTRSLWFCWAIHFSWNFVLGVVLGLPVSGTRQFAALGEGQARGPLWLTGGDYGIEAALSGTVVILLGILVLLLLTRGKWLRAESKVANKN